METRYSTWFLAAFGSLESPNRTLPLNCMRAKRASYRKANGTKFTYWRNLSSFISRRGQMVTIGHSSLGRSPNISLDPESRWIGMVRNLLPGRYRSRY